jgi:hypothetical protein
LRQETIGEFFFVIKNAIVSLKNGPGNRVKPLKFLEGIKTYRDNQRENSEISQNQSRKKSQPHNNKRISLNSGLARLSIVQRDFNQLPIGVSGKKLLAELLKTGLRVAQVFAQQIKIVPKFRKAVLWAAQTLDHFYWRALRNSTTVRLG